MASDSLQTTLGQAENDVSRKMHRTYQTAYPCDMNTLVALTETHLMKSMLEEIVE